ncbi:hypothetical protein SAMN05216337_104277 [Bradyrhizobium brasilense]|uniref:Uncharacterized protein n=1 Tax=Bradyrhizobium brasilense TaxID=1419277 RepID=A0A1G7HNU0_9BRAD|nr:hypothetical protein [Bradyrhizobium brasilense]SDF02093.1 hypothetical protein SAMN05216337_104277 [Bradyrhizobium brasilense]
MAGKGYLLVPEDQAEAKQVDLAAWMFRYETYGYNQSVHRNRFTGVVCAVAVEYWISSDPNLISRQ